MQDLPRSGSQRRLLYDYVVDHPDATPGDVERDLDIPRETVWKEISGLRKRGLLTRTSPGHWRVASSSPASQSTDLPTSASSGDFTSGDFVVALQLLPIRKLIVEERAELARRDEDLAGQLAHVDAVLASRKVPTGEAVFVKPTSNGRRVARCERYEGILRILRDAGRPLSAREIYDIDDLGYTGPDGLRKALRRLLDDHKVTFYSFDDGQRWSVNDA